MSHRHCFEEGVKSHQFCYSIAAMKIFLVATAMTCIFALSLSSRSDQHTPADKQASKTQGQTTIFVNNEDAGAEKNKPPRWYASPEWWVVVLAGLTLSVLWYQAKQMAKATEAMERSSAVMMNAEQGRVVTYWHQIIHYDASPSGTHDGVLRTQFNWACGNTGRTQAELTKIWARFIVINDLRDLLPIPDYSARNERMYQGEPLAPNSKDQQTEWFSTPLESKLPNETISDMMNKRECLLYAYGYVKYVDVWGRPHETRFGILRDPRGRPSLDSWIVAGPSAYNKTT